MTTLNEAMYAYPALKRFPLDTPETAMESYNAFKMQKSAFSKQQQETIEGNFNKAAAYYGLDLTEKADRVVERPRLMFKGASEYVSMTEILTKNDLNDAIKFVLDKRASTPRAVLAEPAKYVLWSASNSDIDMASDDMQKIARIAGIGVGDRENIQKELEKRGTLWPMSDEGKEAFWKYASEVRSLSDDEFYMEENLNTLCNVMDDMDFMHGQQYKHASDLGYPEDVVFADTMDDLIKQASDLYYVPSIDTTLSKQATFERADRVNAFFETHFAGHKRADGEELLNKVASLDADMALALLEDIE